MHGSIRAQRWRLSSPSRRGLPLSDIPSIRLQSFALRGDCYLTGRHFMGKKGHPRGVAQLNLDGPAHVSRPLRGFVLNGGFRFRW